MKDDFWNQTAFWMSELVINGHAMQICGLEVKESAGGTRRLLGTLADGESTIRALFNDKYISTFDRQKLSSNDIIKITKAQSTKLNEETALSVFEFEVVGKYTGVDLLETTEPPRKKPATVAAVRSYKGPHTGKHDAPISPSECAMSQELCWYSSLMSRHVVHNLYCHLVVTAVLRFTSQDYTSSVGSFLALVDWFSA
jgi:hypothetical protein